MRTADRLSTEPSSTVIDGVDDLVRQATARYSDQEFLRAEGTSLSFCEFDAITAGIGQHLVRSGYVPGDRIAIWLQNSWMWPVLWIACLRVGITVVPVNHAYRGKDLAFVLDDADPRAIVTDAGSLATWEQAQAWLSVLPDVLDAEQLCARGAEAGPAARGGSLATSDTLANLQYTSGTTGDPKACMLTHRYWLELGRVIGASARIVPDDVVLCVQTFSYMDPQWHVVMCLIYGACLVIQPRFSVSSFWSSIHQHDATFVYVMGAMPALLSKLPASPLETSHRLRLMLCSEIPANQHAEWESRWAVPIREVYGSTETGADTIVPIDRTDCVGTGTVGWPVSGKEVRLIEPLDRDADDHAVGQLVVRGPAMLLGYWQRPEATGEALVDGWFLTGDLASIDDQGRVRIVGRIKEFIRRGGENISATEVERCLNELDLVAAAGVVPVADETFGQEVKAFVQLVPTADPTAATAQRIAEGAAERIASFKVPRYVQFVTEIPLTTSNRVARTQLDQVEPTSEVIDLSPQNR